jgi:hypothetical protein
LIKEGDVFVTYCPAIELSAYGDTQEEAWESFNVDMKFFLDETERKPPSKDY